MAFSSPSELIDSPAYHYVRDWMNGPSDEQDRESWERRILEGYSNGLRRREINFAQTLMAMKPYTVESSDLTVGQKAWSLISGAFQTRPTPRLMLVENDSFIRYVCTRLENRENIYIFNGGINEFAIMLREIAQSGYYTTDQATMMVKAIFIFAEEKDKNLGECVRYQDLRPNERTVVLSALDSLLRTKTMSLLKDFGEGSIVEGILRMAEFEKTPANLFILWKLFSFIGSSWFLSEGQYSAIWNSFMRYYPVKVNKGADGEKNSTSEELAALLLECMYSAYQFADMSFKYLIERLDNSADLSANKKLEDLEAIDTLVKAYPPSSIQAWSQNLWDSLKFEIWNGEDEELKEKSLTILQSIGKSLVVIGEDFGDHNTPIALYILGAAKECRNRLNDSGTKYLAESSKILYSLSTVSPYAFFLVFTALLPSMFKLLQETSVVTDRDTILKSFNKLLSARLLWNDLGAEDVRQMSEKFSQYRPQFFQAYSSIVFDENLQDMCTRTANGQIPKEAAHFTAAIHGFNVFFEIPGHSSAHESEDMIKAIVDIMFHADHRTKSHAAAISTLSNVARLKPKLYEDLIHNRFMVALPAKYSSRTKEQDKATSHRIYQLLEDMIAISCRPCSESSEIITFQADSLPYWYANFQCAQKALLQKFTELLDEPGQSPYLEVIVYTIYRGLSEFDDMMTPGQASALHKYPGPYEWIVNVLLGHIIVSKEYPENHPFYAEGRTYRGVVTLQHGDPISDSILERVGKTIACVLRSRTTSEENNIIFTHHDVLAGELGINANEFRVSEQSLQDTYDIRHGPMDKARGLIPLVHYMAGLKVVNGDDRSRTKTVKRLLLGDRIAEVVLLLIHNFVDANTPGGVRTKTVTTQYIEILVAKLYAGRAKLPNGHFLWEELCDYAKDESISEEEREALYKSLAYVASAALVVADNDTSGPLIELFLNGMLPDVSERNVARAIAKNFRLLLNVTSILGENDAVKVSRVRISKLYTLAGERLVRRYRLLCLTGSHAFRADLNDPEFQLALHVRNELTEIDLQELKSNTVTALVGILHYQDMANILDQTDESQFEYILPMLLHGLDLKDDSWAKMSCLICIKRIISLKGKEMSRHIDAILDRLGDRIYNTTDRPSDLSALGRVHALDCLSVMIKELDVTSKGRQQLIKNILESAKSDVYVKVRDAARACDLARLYAQKA